MTLERLVLDLSEAGPAAEGLARRAARRGFFGFVDSADRPRIPPSSRLRIYRFRSAKLVERRSSAAGRSVVKIAGPEDIHRAIRVALEPPGVLVEPMGDRVIPIESLIAALQDRGSLWVRVAGIEQVPAALGALEKGAETVVVPVGNVEELARLEELVESTGHTDLDWRVVRVQRVEPVGMADRVLVDTTSLLGHDEGLLVGSHAAFLFAVLSETQGTRFTRPRPFRVNAGALHSYVLMADGTTRYLSELEPGDAVLAASGRTHSRTVRVGRLKIERRPMVIVHTRHRGTPRSIVLQEAETVRLSGPRGPIPITALRARQGIVGVELPPARHLGRGVRESILER